MNPDTHYVDGTPLRPDIDKPVKVRLPHDCKPPIGCKPKWVVEELRCIDLVESLLRQLNFPRPNYEYVLEWVTELQERVQWLRAREMLGEAKYEAEAREQAKDGEAFQVGQVWEKK